MSEKKKGGIGAGLFGDQSNVSYDVYLNLTPLMDVMSNILFFLLAAFGASIVAIMPTTVPTVSSGEPVQQDDVVEESVNVTLRADATGLVVKCESDTINPEELKSLGGKIPKVGADYDYKALTLQLKVIKEKYRASSNIVVVPDEDIRYETVVKLLDASRDTRLVDDKASILFPNVVLSGIATHDIDGKKL